jgi:hypothetical protein
VKDFGEQRRIERLNAVINSTKKWLDDNSEAFQSTDESRQVAETLKAYLRHCRRRLNAGETDLATFNRRLHRIDGAVFVLCKLSIWKKS